MPSIFTGVSRLVACAAICAATIWHLAFWAATAACCAAFGHRATAWCTVFFERAAACVSVCLAHGRVAALCAATAACTHQLLSQQWGLATLLGGRATTAREFEPIGVIN